MKKAGGVKWLIEEISHARFFALMCLWLSVLLILGTLSQAELGLYMAQKKYFESLFFYWGPVPLPGGGLVLILIGLGLSLQLLLKTRWKGPSLGIAITHVGAWILVIGSFWLHFQTHEGNVVLEEGETSAWMSHYHDVELVLTDENHLGFEREYILRQSLLKDKNWQSLGGLPFEIRIHQFETNIEPVKRTAEGYIKSSQEIERHGFAALFDLKALKRSPQTEKNRAGVVFELRRTDRALSESNGFYSVFEAMPVEQTIRMGDEKEPLTVRVRRQKNLLPFEIELIRFEKINYPGTEVAKSYSSQVLLKEGDARFRFNITMNHPLRYKGYTFYQASFLEEEGVLTSVLAGVKSDIWWLPYVASLVMGLGLLLHLILRSSFFREKKR